MLPLIFKIKILNHTIIKIVQQKLKFLFKDIMLKHILEEYIMMDRLKSMFNRKFIQKKLLSNWEMNLFNSFGFLKINEKY